MRRHVYRYQDAFMNDILSAAVLLILIMDPLGN
ncbi:antibiotic transporter, partial [Klebsiella pneumoniae]|nr:antibiotic transporter [Klebsiella pneumoniae]